MHYHVWHGIHEKKEKTIIHPLMQCTKNEKENKGGNDYLPCTIAMC